jgi:hypothetical protein
MGGRNYSVSDDHAKAFTEWLVSVVPGADSRASITSENVVRLGKDVLRFAEHYFREGASEETGKVSPRQRAPCRPQGKSPCEGFLSHGYRRVPNSLPAKTNTKTIKELSSAI